MIEENAGVLRFTEESKPLCGFDVYIESETAQQVHIVGGCEPDSILTLDSKSVLSAKADPMRQCAVYMFDGK